MTDYIFELKNEKVKFYHRFGWLVIAGHFSFFLYLAIAAAEKKIQTLSIAALVLLTILFLLQRYFSNSAWRFGLHPFFFVIMMQWIGLEVYWMAGAMLLFDILHTLSTRPLKVRVTEQMILYPSFPVKKITWPSLNNVILKDNLLTIDLKNNKLIQQPVDVSKSSPGEKDFNEFCRQQLKAAAAATV